MLRYPNYRCPFYVHCDASAQAVGGCIAQLDEETGQLRPMSFHSKELTATEARFSEIGRETLASYEILNGPMNWIVGYNILFSDHMPLKFIYPNSSNNTRLMKWAGCSEMSVRTQQPKTMARQEEFTLSAYNCPVPQSLPETYQPEMINELLE